MAEAVAVLAPLYQLLLARVVEAGQGRPGHLREVPAAVEGGAARRHRQALRGEW